MNISTTYVNGKSGKVETMPGLFRVPSDESKHDYHVFSVNQDGSTSHVNAGTLFDMKVACALLNGNDTEEYKKELGIKFYVVVNNDPKNNDLMLHVLTEETTRVRLTTGH